MNRTMLSVDRRSLLIGSAALAVGAAVLPEAASATEPARVFTAASTAETPAPLTDWSGTAFVDDYKTNTTANQTADTNAAVRILSGMASLWETGSAWNNGLPLNTKVLRANMRLAAEITTERTEADAKQAFIFDRQHQSYSAAGGLGPLESVYRTGAKAVTAITGAPDGVPAGKIDDGVPAGSPAGSATGAGATDSDLGKVVQLVNTLRGGHASSNPSKYAYQYPRPWRMTGDSEVVETGGIPALGVPVYETDVPAVPQLLRQRSTTPSEDGGFPSGHANAVYLAALAYAYAIPERFQELLARAAEVTHSRVLAGMHSPVDVIGGRILATALAAATLYDPANAELKAAARAQALAYLTAQTGASADELYSYAHRESTASDIYADRAANREDWTYRLTYMLERRGEKTSLDVPKGAEALLETRLPYLDADQRREVLRTTALPSGYPLLDGPEGWGRLDLFTAADGYGRLDDDTRVVMDADEGGFHAADTWRGDLAGRGSLTKAGSGSLTLTGDNGFSGGVTVEDGTLAVASATALGDGDVTVSGGRLSVTGSTAVGGDYAQSAATVHLVLDDRDEALLDVDGNVSLGDGSLLELEVDPQRVPAAGIDLPVVAAKRVTGTFAAVTLDLSGYTATASYSRRGVTVRLQAA